MTMAANHLVNLEGQRFGRLLVIVKLPLSGNRKRRYWLCKCDCGTEKPICGVKLRRGITKSCGCYRREVLDRTKHGHAVGRTLTPEYKAWCSMRQRCYNPTHLNFHLWGGRGIHVCDRWRESFQNFLSDMGPRPSRVHSLDRIDPNGNYEPANCRWATTTQQGENRRVNRIVEMGGERLTFTAAVEKYGAVNAGTAFSRVRHGWDETAAIVTPLFGKRIIARRAA